MLFTIREMRKNAFRRLVYFLFILNKFKPAPKPGFFELQMGKDSKLRSLSEIYENIRGREIKLHLCGESKFYCLFFHMTFLLKFLFSTVKRITTFSKKEDANKSSVLFTTALRPFVAENLSIRNRIDSQKR